MAKYKEVDYKDTKNHWPLWVISFLRAILRLLIGGFIDKVISPSDELPRNEDVVLGDDEISVYEELIFAGGTPASFPPYHNHYNFLKCDWCISYSIYH